MHSKRTCTWEVRQNQFINLVPPPPPSSALLLLGELSGVSGCGERVSSLLPLCAETLRHKHYPQHLNLLETLLKLVRFVVMA